MNGPYDDIISLPHPVSTRHAPMKAADRAAQFSPFSALTGYEDAIRETGRLTLAEREPEEEEKLRIGERLQLLADRISEHPPVELILFRRDEWKEGGALISRSGTVQCIDAGRKCLILTDRSVIPFSSIRSLESPLFHRAEPEDP